MDDNKFHWYGVLRTVAVVIIIDKLVIYLKIAWETQSQNEKQVPERLLEFLNFVLLDLISH